MADPPIPPFFDATKLPWWFWTPVILIGGIAGWLAGFHYNGIGGGILGFIWGAAIFSGVLGVIISYWPLAIVVGIIGSLIALFWNVGLPKH
jgi:hypothetical protein